jgi:hypothetical protein
MNRPQPFRWLGTVNGHEVSAGGAAGPDPYRTPGTIVIQMSMRGSPKIAIAVSASLLAFGYPEVLAQADNVPDMIVVTESVLAWYPKHPHAIQDAQDAIATAAEIWKARWPDAPLSAENWQLKFMANLVDGVWVIDDGEGFTITLDPKDGHVITATVLMFHEVRPRTR